MQTGRSDGPPLPIVLHHIQPSLERIEFCDWTSGFDEALVEKLCSECPRLRYISPEYLGDEISPNDLSTLFRNRSFRSVELGLEYDALNAKVFGVLSQMEDLRELSIMSTLFKFQFRLSTIEFSKEGSDSLVARIWEDMHCHIGSEFYHLIQGPLRTRS